MEYAKLETQKFNSCIAGEHQVQSHTYMKVYVYPTSVLARYQKLTYVLKSKAGGYVASIHETLAIARSWVGGATQA